MSYTFEDTADTVLGYSKDNFIRGRNRLVKETVDGVMVRSARAMMYAKRPMLPQHLPKVSVEDFIGNVMWSHRLQYW